MRIRALIASLLLLPTIASAQTYLIGPGVSVFHADPASCYIDFSFYPIPANAFGPGSDPFTGLVALQGVPVTGFGQCPSLNLTGVEAILERKQTIDLATQGSSIDIDVEMVAMELVSAQPITVTFGGGKRAQQFDVEVKPTPPSTPWKWEFQWGVSYLQLQAAPSMGAFGHEFKADFRSAESGELAPIQIEIASSMPLVIVQKHRASSSKAECADNYCMNETVPLSFTAPGFQISLLGSCMEDPVAAREISWGAVKSGY